MKNLGRLEVALRFIKWRAASDSAFFYFLRRDSATSEGMTTVSALCMVNEVSLGHGLDFV